MSKDDEIINTLKGLTPNAYLQPPSKLSYPCVTVHKGTPVTDHANNIVYFNKETYQLTVIENNFKGTLADSIIKEFQYCFIVDRYINDSLYHTVLNLHY